MIRIHCQECNKKKRVRRKDLTIHCSRHLLANLNKSNAECFSRVRISKTRKKVTIETKAKVSKGRK